MSKDNTAKKVFAGAMSVVQIGGGVALTIFTGGLGSAAGASLIGSGVSSGFKVLTGQPEDLTVESYLQECAIGGVTGLFSGGLSAVGSSVTKKLAVEGGKRVAITLAAEATAGAVGQVTSRVGRNIVEEKEAFEDIGVGDVMTGMVAGGLSSGLGQAAAKGMNKIGSRILSEAVEDTTEQVLSKGKQILLDTVTGSVTGATGAATATMVRNVAEDKNIFDGVGSATLTGATIGAAISAGRSSREQNRAETKSKTIPQEDVRMQPEELVQFKKTFRSLDGKSTKTIQYHQNTDGSFYATELGGTNQVIESIIDSSRYPPEVRTGHLTQADVAKVLRPNFSPANSYGIKFITIDGELLPVSGTDITGLSVAPNHLRNECLRNTAELAAQATRQAQQTRGQQAACRLASAMQTRLLSLSEIHIAAKELKKHVVLVHAINHHNAIGGHHSEEFYNLHGNSAKYNDTLAQCQFLVEKEIEDGVIGHFLNYSDAAFNEEKSMLDRPHTHWSWNELVQPNSGGNWEHCRVAVLEPFNEIFEDRYYAIAPYDTQMSHPHRLSTHSVVLLPDSMQGQPPALPNFQGRIVYYDSNKSLRIAIAETLQTVYPQVWPIVDSNGLPCAAAVYQSHTGYRPKTVLKKSNGEYITLFRQENSRLHPAMAEMRDQGKFIGLHVNSTTYLLEADTRLLQLKQFIDNKRVAVFAQHPQAFICSNHATRNTLIIQSAFKFYLKMLKHHESTIGVYILRQAIYADFVSLYHQAGLSGIPSQPEMYLLFSEKYMTRILNALTLGCKSEEKLDSYRKVMHKRLVFAKKQRKFPINGVVVSDEFKQGGDSLFEAVAVQAAMGADDLRATAAAYLLLFKDKYVGRLPVKGSVHVGNDRQSISYNGFEQYCQHIQTPQAWASTIEAQVIAYALNRPVMVLQANTARSPMVFNKASTQSPIILALMYGKLFTFFKPKQTGRQINTNSLYRALSNR